LHISQTTVNRDLQCLRQEAKENIKKYIDEKLPEEYEKTLCGLNSILREAWTISQASETGRMEKIKALSLAKDCYSMKLELLTNATVVDDAIRFVRTDRNSSNTKSSHSEIAEPLSQMNKTKREIGKDILTSEANSGAITVKTIF
jgi:hypothetical protein